MADSRGFTLQDSGLVKTVGPCAQRRVALMPRAIETHCIVLVSQATPHNPRERGVW